MTGRTTLFSYMFSASVFSFLTFAAPLFLSRVLLRAREVIAVSKFVLRVLLHNILLEVLRRHARKLGLMLTVWVLDPFEDIRALDELAWLKEASII